MCETARDPSVDTLGTPYQRGNNNTQFNYPEGVALNDNGNIIVADEYNNRVQMFSYNGKYVRTIGSKGTNPAQLQQPQGIAITADGYIIVAESGNNRVSMFDETGQFILE